MKYIGAHVSIAGGIENAPLNAAKIGARAFAMFTKNQRQWQARPLERKNIGLFLENLQKAGILPEQVLPHDGYLINLGNPDPGKRQRAVEAFIDEARRVEQLGLSMLNFHPGSHLRLISEEECVALVAQGISRAIDETDHVVFVIETTAGQGSNIGYTFEQIAALMEQVNRTDRVGVCIDTCHIYAAGYDIKGDYDGVTAEFDRVIGFAKLRGVHLNDSKSVLGQKVDRHHSLGEGTLGWEVFEKIAQDRRFDAVPLILETIDEQRWPDEISRLMAVAARSVNVSPE